VELYSLEGSVLSIESFHKRNLKWQGIFGSVGRKEEEEHNLALEMMLRLSVSKIYNLCIRLLIRPTITYGRTYIHDRCIHNVMQPRCCV